MSSPAAVPGTSERPRVLSGIGLMVFAYFVSRFLLFLTAWAAVVAQHRPQPAQAPTEAGAIVPEVAVGSRPDAAR